MDAIEIFLRQSLLKNYDTLFVKNTNKKKRPYSQQTRQSQLCEAKLFTGAHVQDIFRVSDVFHLGVLRELNTTYHATTRRNYRVAS